MNYCDAARYLVEFAESSMRKLSQSRHLAALSQDDLKYLQNGISIRHATGRFALMSVKSGDCESAFDEAVSVFGDVERMCGFVAGKQKPTQDVVYPC